ncbi:tRNA-dependent cyclodipeptide synthase [Dapis sp. BLCC M172]|uniref:tRNA-dependent cyclodipeptide synthase n=1 Tax=Dapis sp. BLCC M172 TaxID=2975281 RepID=UPI003CF6FD40
MSSHIDQEKIIENFDWSQLSLENLNLLKSKISKTISIKRRELFLTNNANINLVDWYKASLAKVYPHSLRSSLFNYDKCVFGISLGSKNFTDTKRIEACIKWISENFKTCLVLVTDSIYRLTMEVRQGIEGDEAWLEAIRTGEEFVNENGLLFEEYSESCQFELKRTSEILKRSDFSIYYEELQNLYQKNQSFQSMVNSFAEAYLNRGELIEAEQVEELRQKHLAITYLFEESAINACLVKEGWQVFVYPGSIKTFEEISEGLYPEVPEALKQMIWVSLRLKKRNARSGNEK